MKMKFFLALLIGFWISPALSTAQIQPSGTESKSQTYRIPPQRFQWQRLPRIPFRPFGLSDFKLRSGQEMVRLKSGKTIKADQFLREVNEVERRLNEWGHTLRDNRPVRIGFDYAKTQIRLQKEIFLRNLKTVALPPQIFCQEGPSAEGETFGPMDRPRDFVPLNWERNWDASFGNDDFGVKLAANMKIEGRENELNVQPFFLSEISLLGSHVGLLRMEKKENLLTVRLLEKRELRYSLAHEWKDKELFHQPFDWSTDIGFPLGPIEVTGKISLTGKVRLIVSQKNEPSSSKVEGSFSPSLWAKIYGRLETDFKIAEVGMSGEILLVDEGAHLAGSLELVRSPNRYFRLSASGRNRVTLLRGRLLAYAEIDYLLGSKRFEVDLFDFEGIDFDQPLFAVNTSLAAEKDHHVWLQVDQISGITPYTARNEKLELDPRQFDLIVEIGGRRYVKELKDFNRDGRYGNVLGEYEAVRYEVPMLSFGKIPICIEVIQRYRIGTFEFNDLLDLAPGIGRRVELCFDPRTRTFTGTASGKEDEEVRSIGDSNYWGERHHQIIFEFTTRGFAAAPGKAK